MLGTNPLCFGIPTDEAFPFVIDCATSVNQRGAAPARRYRAAASRRCDAPRPRDAAASPPRRRVPATPPCPRDATATPR